MYLFFDLIMGILFLAAGFYFRLNPPLYIDGSLGYRSKRSTKNEDTWEEANRYAADMLIYAGIFSTAVALFMYAFERNPTGLVVTVVFSLLSGALFLLLTEFHLMTTFDENGERKLRTKSLN